tara:strand:+ start:523 stop:1341 length:819 start_codon:yes stop_codon:yes gene_type:complete
MYNKRGNFYGILLSFLMIIILIGLFTSDSETTGFATKTTKCFEGTDFGECSPVKPKYCDNGALKPDCQKCGCIEGRICQEDGNCLQTCSDGTLFGQCSENKPLLCHKGSLLENCFECGCSPGQTCLNNGACAGDVEIGAGEVAKCSDNTPYGECSIEKPAYCDNGKLVDNCFECGCEQGEMCGEGGICEPIQKCADGSIYGECSFLNGKFCQDGRLIANCEMCGCDEGEFCSNGKCSKELPKVSFLWNTFCKIFYFNEYNDCILDAARNQNK